MSSRWVVATFMLLALAACDQPSLDDSDAQGAVKDIPGVVNAAADCSNPIESGPSCVLVVNVEPDLDAEKILTVIDKAKPALVGDVDDIRVVSDEISLTLNRERMDERELAVDELVTMRGLDHVASGTIDVRGSGDFRVEAVTDSLDAGLAIATALRSDETPDVTVTGAGLLLIAGAGLPESEFAFARLVPKAVAGVSLMRVVLGEVTAYCTGSDAQAAVKAKIPSLPGYADVATVNVFQDAP
jgi:hypothetical protein